MTKGSTPELLVAAPSGRTRSIRLEGRKLTLGRSATNTLAFPEDDGLSRSHLVIQKDGARWFVENLSGKNGTFVNGARLRSKHYLESGDRITASCVTLMVSQRGSDGSRNPATDLDAESTSLEEVLSSGRAESRADGLPRESRVSALWAVVRAARELSLRRPLPELFRLTLDLSLEAVGAQRGVLLTLDEGDRLVVQASRGPQLRISTAVKDRVLKEKTSLLVRDAREDPQLQGSRTIKDEGVQSLIAVPLQTEDRVIGLLYLDSVDPRRSFTGEDLSLLTAMANVAGIRIERERWEDERRLLIAENVEGLGRLAAALSHEFNTPLGTLKSTIDTLVRAAARGRTAAPDERERLDAVQRDLRGSMDSALARMEQVISRIQRFTNLDRAEIQAIDVNEVLSDVVALTAERSVEVELSCAPGLPSVRGHRPSLSASLSALVRFAIEASRQSGARGKVLIATAAGTNHVEIRIEDSGGGMTPDRVARLFDPGFHIAEGRVSAGDFRLFTARQVIQKHGGEIRVESELGRGSTCLVSVPWK